MRLLLTSSGFTNDDIAAAAAGLAGKRRQEIRFSIINEAHAVETGDKRWILNELENFGRYFTGIVDFVDLLALSPQQIKDRLRQTDAIYVLGGNTDYLKKVFDRSGFTQALPELLQTKVYIGSSAGSQVVAKRLATPAYLSAYGEPETFDVNEYLGYVDFSIQPHLNSVGRKETEVEQVVTDDMPLPQKLYSIDDNCAIKVVDATIEVIGSGTWRVYG